MQRGLRGSGPHRPTRAVSADSDAGIAPAMELYDNCLQHTARTSSTHTALRRRCFRSDGTQAERAHGRGSIAARMPAANARVTGSVQTPLWGGGPHKPVRAVSAESDAGIVPPMALYENDLQHTTRAVSDCSAPQSPARPARSAPSPVRRSSSDGTLPGPRRAHVCDLRLAREPVECVGERPAEAAVGLGDGAGRARAVPRAREGVRANGEAVHCNGRAVARRARRGGSSTHSGMSKRYANTDTYVCLHMGWTQIVHPSISRGRAREHVQ